MAYLTIEKGSNKGASHELPDTGCVIVGRSKKADFRLKDRFVSREHFRIEVEDGTYRLQDLDSDNGTFVNGEAVEKARLEDGDHLQIGETHISFISDESHQEEEDLIGETVGGHEILERIGRGGMGTVYKARQVSLDRVVALKILASDLVEDEKFVEQFLSEARSAATLNHPNVAQVYDVGDDNGVYFLSMEYIRGGSLHDLLSERDILDPEQAAEITMDIARALDFARRKELVHRDIKPGNIMLTEEGKAKLIDLGIAKQGMKEWEDEGVMVGTPDYMAPEQATDESVDTQADIYALGVTFYRMVTGERPIKGQSSDEVIQNKFEEDPIPPSSKNEDVPEWMSSLIMDMIRVEPDQRITTPEQVVERIKQEGGAPSMFTVRGIKNLANKRVRPRRWPLFAGAAAVLVILIGTTYFFASQTSSNRSSSVTKQPSDKGNGSEKGGADKEANDDEDNDSSSGEDQAQNEQETGGGNKSDEAKKRLKTLEKLRETAQENRSVENLQEAIVGHRRFLKEFSEHPSQDQVMAHLKQLKQQKERLHLDRQLARLREAFESLQSTFRDLSPATPDQIEEAKTLLDSGSVDVLGVSDLQGKIENIIAEHSRSLEKIRTLKQDVTDWYETKRKQLSIVRQTLDSFSEKLENGQFREVAQQLKSLRKTDTFQEKPFTSVLDQLKHRFRTKERQFYFAQTNEVVDAIVDGRFEQASSLMTTARDRIVSEKYRTKLAEEKKRLVQRRRRNKADKQREKKRAERESIFKQGIERMVQMEARNIAPQEPPLTLKENLEFEENKKYGRIFQFLTRQYRNFFQLLGNRAASFNHNIINDQELGKVEIIDASPTGAELDIPNVSATSNRSWSEFSITTLLDFVYENRGGLTPSERISLATMFYLFDHRKNVSKSNFQSLIEQGNLEFNDIAPDTARSLLERNNERFQEFTISSLIQAIHRHLSKGNGVKAWRYARFLQKRFRSHPYFREREEEIQKLFEYAEAISTNPDQSRIETWSVFIRPHVKYFENNHLPRIEHHLTQLDFRMEYGRRGRILLYLGRYEEAYDMFQTILPENWLEKLKQGRFPASERRNQFYISFYKSAVLAGKSQEIQDVLRKTAIQRILETENTRNRERANQLRNWQSNLEEKRKVFQEETLSFIGSRKQVERLIRIKESLGAYRLPDLKMKFMVTRSLLNEFGQTSSVQSQAGDLLLESAKLLMKLGDYPAAKDRLEQFVSSYPTHDRISDVKEESGLLEKCRKKMTYYSIQ